MKVLGRTVKEEVEDKTRTQTINLKTSTRKAAGPTRTSITSIIKTSRTTISQISSISKTTRINLDNKTTKIKGKTSQIKVISITININQNKTINIRDKTSKVNLSRTEEITKKVGGIKEEIIRMIEATTKRAEEGRKEDTTTKEAIFKRAEEIEEEAKKRTTMVPETG